MQRKTKIWLGALVSLAVCASAAPAKDLGDILREKGLITPEELKQARQEEKQKAAAEEAQTESDSCQAAEVAELHHPVRRRADALRELLSERHDRPQPLQSAWPHRLDREPVRRNQCHGCVWPPVTRTTR